MVHTGSGFWSGARVLCLLASAVLAGCLDDGGSSAQAVPASNNSSAANRAPTISGSAGSSVAVGGSYAFTPAAADADGDVLTFSVQNLPTWATFNAQTGRLAGTPAAGDIGTYANIVVRVSDGAVTTSLAAFSIAVTQIGVGTATLSWLPPTENEDGSPLVNLAGYYIFYGTSASALSERVQVDNASINRYVVENLTPTTWYFSVKAYSSTGAESAFSAIASKIIS